MTVLECKLQGGGAWRARLQEVSGREAAEEWRHGEAALERAALPQAAAGEFYWHDLIGANVENKEGAALGVVVGVLETGANDVLRVQTPAGGELLIPFVENYILSDSLGANAAGNATLRVDWREDW